VLFFHRHNNIQADLEHKAGQVEALRSPHQVVLASHLARGVLSYFVSCSSRSIYPTSSRKTACPVARMLRILNLQLRVAWDLELSYLVCQLSLNDGSCMDSAFVRTPCAHTSAYGNSQDGMFTTTGRGQPNWQAKVLGVLDERLFGGRC
jgi:hypothetical protein